VAALAVVAAVMARQRLRHGAHALLSVLIATGVVFVGIGGLERNAILFAVGFWLVTLGLVVLMLLHRGPPPR
jgi:hypothetical protein